MIIDNLDNAEIYADAIAGLTDAFAYVRTVHPDAPEGRVELPGLNGYALVVEYPTEHAADRKLETHRRFVDLQVVLSGRELIQWTPSDSLERMTEYDAENDVEFWKDGPASELILPAGQFAIFYPADAHKPGCWIDPETPVTIRKLVVKIPV